MPLSAHLTVRTGAEAALAASEWIRSFGATLGLTPRDVYRLDLCVTELVTNIATHGYGDDEGVIELHAEECCARQRVRLEIVDGGKPFDPFAHGPPLIGENGDIPIGGLGIALVRGFADTCSYARQEARNVVALTIVRENETAA